jgi:protein-S-isoprenylcysteine O-methyltransferase Ste14
MISIDSPTLLLDLFQEELVQGCARPPTFGTIAPEWRMNRNQAGSSMMKGIAFDFAVLMNPFTFLNVVGLIVGSVYCTIPLFWLTVHGCVNRWRTGGPRSYALILPIWGLFIAATFSAAWRFRSLHLYQSWAAWIPGAAFILLGFSIYRSAFQGFDRSKLSGLAEIDPVRQDQALIVNGIREKVRHPIYLGHFCEVFGWCLGTGSIALTGLLLFAAVTGAAMIQAEDNELEERFGERYREYRRMVPAFLPKNH